MVTHDDYPETHNPTTEMLSVLSVEQPDKDSFRLGGNESDLLFVAGRLMQLLDPDLQPEQVARYVEAIDQQIDEIRPSGGVFAVSMVRNPNKDKEGQGERLLFVGNRNMRGYKPVQEQLAKAVADALNPDKVVIENDNK